MGRSRRSWLGLACAGALLVAACGAFSSANDSSVGVNGPSDGAGNPDAAGDPGGTGPALEGGSTDAQGPPIDCSCPDATPQSVCESFASASTAKACGWNAEPPSLSFDFTSNGLVVPTGPADAASTAGFLRRKLTGLTTLSVDVTTSLTEMKSLSTRLLYLETETTTLAFILYKGLASSALTIGISGGSTTNVSLSGTFKVTFTFTGSSVSTTVRKGGENVLVTMNEVALKSSTFGVGLEHVTTPIGSGAISFSNFRATFD